MKAEGKANCFAGTFEPKNAMIDEEANEYSHITDANRTFYFGLPIIKATQKASNQPGEDNALGPNKLPTRILKRCAHMLAPVLHTLILPMLTIEKWPALWMVHWMVPPFKRTSVY